MAVVVVKDGSVTWASHSSLIATTGAVMDATINTSHPPSDSTALSASGVSARTNILGIGTWTATLNGRPNAAIIADSANIGSFSNTYTNLKSWALNITVDSKPSTVFDQSSGVSWRSFLPGLYKATGTFTSYADSSASTALSGGTETSVDFVITDPSGDGGSGTADSVILTADIRITGVGIPVKVGETVEQTYSFETTSTITETGDLATTFLDDLLSGGVFTPPVLVSPNDVLLTIKDGASAGNTYAGDAHLSALNLSATVGEPITWSATAQGTGALVVS